jgi:TolB-like protein/Flp pilus assembly protein TadD
MSLISASTLNRVIMVVLAIAVAYFAIDKFVFPPGPPPISSYDKSIAVLPFQDMSSEQDQAYFADGIAEEILNVLARVEKLRVVSRSTSFTYRGPVDLSEVGKDLEVSYILEGSVRKAGNTVRVTAQLIDAANDAQVWSETFDRELVDIFDIQDDIAATVAGHLDVAIAKRHREAQKTDPETYAFYLRARHGFYGQTGNDTDYSEEIRLLRLVLERDPEFVPAMTLLVTTLTQVASMSDPAVAGEVMGLIDNAYAVDPDDALATMYKGWKTFMETGDWEASIPYAERALMLEPSNVEVLRSAAFAAAQLGRVDDALKLLREAIKREPLCIPCATAQTQITMQDHRWDEAEPVLRRRIEIDSQDVGGHVNLAMVLMYTGRAEEALLIVDEWGAVAGEDLRLHLRGVALDKLGRHNEADESIALMREQFGDDHFKLLNFYAARQDVDQTLYWVSAAIAEDPGVFPMLERDTQFEFLADNEQWQRWVEELGTRDEDTASVEFNIPDFD